MGEFQEGSCKVVVEDGDTYWDLLEEAGQDPIQWPHHADIHNPQLADPRVIRRGQELLLCESPEIDEGMVDGTFGPVEETPPSNPPTPVTSADPSPPTSITQPIEGSAKVKAGERVGSGSAEPDNPLELDALCPDQDDWSTASKIAWSFLPIPPGQCDGKGLPTYEEIGSRAPTAGEIADDVGTGLGKAGNAISQIGSKTESGLGKASESVRSAPAKVVTGLGRAVDNMLGAFD